MDGINGNTPVNRSTKIMGYDTVKAVNIAHMVNKLDASQVNICLESAASTFRHNIVCPIP